MLLLLGPGKFHAEVSPTEDWMPGNDQSSIVNSVADRIESRSQRLWYIVLLFES